MLIGYNIFICTGTVNENMTHETVADQYKREARAVVSELLEQGLVPDDRRDEVERLLEAGEPLMSLRVAQSNDTDRQSALREE